MRGRTSPRRSTDNTLTHCEVRNKTHKCMYNCIPCYSSTRLRFCSGLLDRGRGDSPQEGRQCPHSPQPHELRTTVLHREPHLLALHPPLQTLLHAIHVDRPAPNCIVEVPSDQSLDLPALKTDINAKAFADNIDIPSTAPNRDIT